MRDDGSDATVSRCLAVGFAGVALVSNGRTWLRVRPQIQQDRKVRRVALLAAGQVKGDWVAVEIRLQVDFGCEATARAPEPLALLPPLAPAAETCARTIVLSNICTRWADMDSEAR